MILKIVKNGFGINRTALFTMKLYNFWEGRGNKHCITKKRACFLLHSHTNRFDL